MANDSTQTDATDPPDNRKSNTPPIDKYVYPNPSHVIAIGASAGGLEALETLFDALPDELGCAFVVVQHLSPDFKSMMDELLKKHTNMPTHQATEGETLLANTVYLIPAGKLMRVTDGKIYLSELPPDNRINLPINEFFRTLAEDAQNRAVGIILSGTGSDGCRGIQAMKEAGAMVIAQDPEEAQFNGMPQNAINTGSVDFVLKVADMPQYIKNFISHPLTDTTTDKFKYHLSQNTSLLEQILKIIQKQTDLDFKAYKESTVSRRIEHRMSINNKLSLQEYWEYLQENENEIELVKQDLLIGVTQFFRDGELWDKVREEVVRPLIVESSPKEPIRIWSTGCSTGEEAYTIAMIFDSTIKELGLERTVKVFASDIDQTAVAYAATGIYPAGISNEVPSAFLDRYFHVLADGNYQVTKELRSLVVLATHNVIQDPPFSNMDFVSCRNMLIYLQTPAQQKALAFFHFALKKNAYMILGSAESPGNFSNYFDTIDSKYRIYQKTQDLRIPVSSITTQGIRRGGFVPKTIPQYIDRANKRNTKPRNRLIGSRVLQDRYVPPTFIIDTKLQLIYSYGDTSIFTTKLKPGEVTNDIADILVADVTSHVLSAAHQVLREDKGLVMQHVIHETAEDGKHVSYSLNCFSFTEEDEIEKYIAISFVPEYATNHDISDIVYTPEEQTEQRILDLDASLVECQRMYREALEDLDTTSEELQSSNEELMAANEELQSTNEELQSVNEELYTVNSEYQQKIIELTDTNNDLENLLTATELAVLFLDSELRIRRYTRPLTHFLNIMDFDLNRPFMDLSLKFDFDGLHELINSVNNGASPIHKVVDVGNAAQIEISISPYTIGKNNNGVVVSMRELK